MITQEVDLEEVKGNLVVTPGARCGELLSSVHCYGLVWLMVESMTPSNPVYTSLVTLPKSGEWKTKACSFPYFFVLLLNYSTLSRLFYIRGKWSWFCMYRFTSFGWWLICLSYYFMIVFGSENNWKDTNFLSFENIKKSNHASLYISYLLQWLLWCFIHCTMSQITGCFFHKCKQIQINYLCNMCIPAISINLSYFTHFHTILRKHI